MHCHHGIQSLKLEVGCTKCHWEGKGFLPNPLDSIGNIKCPTCKTKDMAIIISDDILCVGCRKCSWECRTSLIPDLTRIN